MVDDRPTVSVVMPFAGSDADARRALAALERIRLAPGDELVVADNTASGLMSAASGSFSAPVRVVPTGAERSSSRAKLRRAGGARGVAPVPRLGLPAGTGHRRPVLRQRTGAG